MDYEGARETFGVGGFHLSTRSTARLGLGLAAGAVSLLVMASPATAAPGSWSIVPTPSSGNGNDALNGVGAVSDSDAWAVGNTFTAPDANGSTVQPLTLHWNGTAWQRNTAVTAPPNSVLLGVAASSATDAWAVGRRNAQGYGGSFPVLLHWNGSAWSTANQPIATGALNAAVALSPTDAWAVGRAGRFGPQLIEHWNGSQWSTVDASPPDPNYTPGGQLTAISARAANDIWALGTSSTVGAYAQHWNGTAWTLSFLSSAGGNAPSSVVAVGPNDVWATVNVSNGGAAYIQHWNGTAWSVSTTRPAIEYPKLAGITARSATDIWAIGGFLGNVNTPSPTREVRTLHWNGTQWTVGTAPNGGGVQVNGSGLAPGGTRTWAVGTAAGAFVLGRTN